jgi:hypothetical protein
MNIAKPLFSMVTLASLALTACSGASGEVDEQVGTAHQDSIALNSLALNSLALNSLALNSLALNGLEHSLEDPGNRDVFKYVVGCALPVSESLTLTVQGVSYTFNGELGLAPEWGEEDGSCGDSCQQWVSACVIARTDFLGQAKLISLRGDNPGLQTTASERSAYSSGEAAYYGDIFDHHHLRLYACLYPGQAQIPRVCGPSIASCGVDVVGSCDQVCGKQRADGSFSNCSAPDGDDGHGDHHKKHDKDDVFHGSITVFLNP